MPVRGRGSLRYDTSRPHTTAASNSPSYQYRYSNIASTHPSCSNLQPQPVLLQAATEARRRRMWQLAIPSQYPTAKSSRSSLSVQGLPNLLLWYPTIRQCRMIWIILESQSASHKLATICLHFLQKSFNFHNLPNNPHATIDRRDGTKFQELPNLTSEKLWLSISTCPALIHYRIPTWGLANLVLPPLAASP